MISDNTEHHRQTKSRTSTGCFRCEEGLEDALLGLGIHPASIVRDFDLDLVPLL